MRNHPDSIAGRSQMSKPRTDSRLVVINDVDTTTNRLFPAAAGLDDRGIYYTIDLRTLPPELLRLPSLGEQWWINRKMGRWVLHYRETWDARNVPANGWLSPADYEWQGVGAVGQPEFENNWVNAVGYASAAFRRDPIGFVHLKGTLAGGDKNSRLFQLPSGHRPPATLRFAVRYNYTVNDAPEFGSCSLIIGSDGSVTQADADPNADPVIVDISIDGCVFYGDFESSSDGDTPEEPEEPGFKGIFNIATSEVSTVTGYANQRKVDRTQNDVIWATRITTNSTSYLGYFDYSTDDGVTWTATGGINLSVGGDAKNHTANGSFFIDKNDYAHFVWKAPNDGYIYYRRGTPNTARTAWTWSAAHQLYASDTVDYPDIVAHQEGTEWVAHAVYSRAQSGADFVLYNRIDISSSGTITVNTAEVYGRGDAGTNYGNTVHKWPSIDFNHIGDGKTIAEGTPHLYSAWSAGAAGVGMGIRFKKATYSGGSWTWGTEREISPDYYANVAGGYSLNCLFDGTRIIIGGLVAPDLTHILWERDSADTTTTPLYSYIPVGTDVDYAAFGSLTYDSQGNVYRLGRNTDAIDSAIRYVTSIKYDRGSGTRSAERLLTIAGDGSSIHVSTRRSSGNRIEFVYTDGTVAPYDVVYGSTVL